ncbi:pirin family protein [Bermanella marisrubri]|uniref:Pirin-related protein n=1 Tax=Bermanella marisrubri TaxID=207949 RepID=Q1MZB2_9GAMM|nr:pirin family protein [Bermanella marisrubri]EAT11354.1 hypothetical protein RED65_13042 [Oceanobacter sp. RED65] [Bermanella marisrubri]QIZ85260.1 pirin family protein [Bermanella marisrubri]
MDYIRKASDRGHADFGWLNSHHSFSFGSYYDPRHMGFSTLRVINDDTVAPGAGFDTHGHANMEIISYITHGRIAHKDSMGHEYVIPANDIQRMSAGTGITHSEYNHSQNDVLKFLQIWIEPQQHNIRPSYEQIQLPEKTGLTLLMSPEPEDGSLAINSDARLYRLTLEKESSTRLERQSLRTSYLHIVSGRAEINGQMFEQGDGIGLMTTESIEIHSKSNDFVALWFDLPGIKE